MLREKEVLIICLMTSCLKWEVRAGYSFSSCAGGYFDLAR